MINFLEPRTLDFRYSSIKKEPGEANTKKRRFLYADFLLYQNPLFRLTITNFKILRAA